MDNLEEVLVTSDVGVNTTLKIIERIEERVSRDKYMGTDELNTILREEIAGLLSETNSGEDTEIAVPKDKKPYVIMVVGVNGVGDPSFQFPALDQGVTGIPLHIRKMGGGAVRPKHCQGIRHLGLAQSEVEPLAALSQVTLPRPEASHQGSAVGHNLNPGADGVAVGQGSLEQEADPAACTLAAVAIQIRLTIEVLHDQVHAAIEVVVEHRCSFAGSQARLDS